MIWRAILMAALIARYCFNSYSRLVIVSMKKTVYDIYLCLAESKKQNMNRKSSISKSRLVLRKDRTNKLTTIAYTSMSPLKETRNADNFSVRIKESAPSSDLRKRVGKEDHLLKGIDR